VRTVDFDYHLPPELVAQHPAGRRDGSRLLVLDRASGRIEHRAFTDLPGFLRAGDLAVFNDSRVIPARLRGHKAASGGEVELLLVEENSTNDWWTLLRPGKRVRIGTEIALCDRTGRPAGLHATVTEKNDQGHCRLTFSGPENILTRLDELGEIPLPPYINRPEHFDQADDRERYQTIYARPPGSVAAPTAGLHFTPAVMEALRARGVRTAFVTLHVGLGTFAPIQVNDLADHVMHEERYVVPEATAALLRETRAAGRRVVAIGTTTARVLESSAEEAGGCRPGAGRTRLFIHPPRRFQVVDALVTNFHLPQSTLLMLVSAFAAPGEARGRDLALAAYAEAVRERYRFFSYGDAMLIV
jgi:S-adenosylmethionine:tRNA ribosyltransferase-isomerase